MISVIIPNHNCGPLLAKCINSVRKQTYRKWEIIVVDDASTDDSLDVLSKFQGIQVIRNDRSVGCGAARNIGIAQSSGDSLFFLDSDDWIDPNQLQDLATEAMVHQDCGRIFSPDLIEWPSKGWCWPHDVTPLGLLRPDNPHLFTPDCDLGHSTGCLYIKDRIPCKVRFPEIVMFEDMIMNMGLVFAGVSTFATKAPRYHYVRRGDSLLSRTLTHEEADDIRGALRSLADTYHPDQETYDRFSAFLENAMKNRIQ